MVSDDITAKLAEALTAMLAEFVPDSSPVRTCAQQSAASLARAALADYRHHTEAQAGGTEGALPPLPEAIGFITRKHENGVLVSDGGRIVSIACLTDDQAPQGDIFTTDQMRTYARAALAAAPAAAQGDVREQFEAHCHRDRQWSTERLAEAPDEYLWHVVASAWQTWKAAHEAGRQQGMSQANALWEMAKAEQAVPVAVVEQTGWELCDNTVFVFGVPVQNFGSRLLDAVAFANRINAAARATPPATERRPLTVPPEIMAIAERLHTQDNRITDNPLFAVLQKRCIAGLDEDYTDSFEWVTDDCEEIHDAAEIADLEAAHAEGEDTPGARRIGVRYIWEFVTGCFTEQGCKSYIASNGHNLHEPRIYAYGSYRNAKFIALRNWLMSITAGTTEQAKEQE